MIVADEWSHDDVIKWKKKSALLAVCAGEFTGHRWTTLSKASDAELWCSLWSAPEQTVAWANNRRRWFETPSRSLWRHCNEKIDSDLVMTNFTILYLYGEVWTFICVFRDSTTSARKVSKMTEIGLFFVFAQSSSAYKGISAAARRNNNVVINKVWWLCLVPTSTTRFASEVGYRIAKIWHGYTRKIFFMNNDI